jgi:pimeloyl-ACP methyl ester carboxylesterase
MTNRDNGVLANSSRGLVNLAQRQLPLVASFPLSLCLPICLPLPTIAMLSSVRPSPFLPAMTGPVLYLLLQLAAIPTAVVGTPTPNAGLAARRQLNQRATHNDYSCRSTTHPNPVVLLHGLGATYYEDLNFLEAFLQSLDYCTFSLTYGAYQDFAYVGGLMPISESAQEIATFIHNVRARTGATKVDLVGHSEGGFQVLYVPKFEPGVAAIVDKQVAIASPTHGTSFAALYNLAMLFGNSSIELIADALDATGCPACADLVTDGAAVQRLVDDGRPIVQPGSALTVITSREDELVTPTTTSFVNEPGVANIYVQDYCPFDLVGHIGEAYDLNVWNLLRNALDETPDREFPCAVGSLGRV